MLRGAPPPAAIASPLIAIDFGEARKATTLATSAASTRCLMELASAMRCSTTPAATPCAFAWLGRGVDENVDAAAQSLHRLGEGAADLDRKSTRLNSSH